MMKFTNQSDGTGETAVKKVDVSALVGSPTEVVIRKITYTTHGIGVSVLWDANVNLEAVRIPQDEHGILDFTRFGGLVNDAGIGVTGDILFTTTETPVSGDGYTVVLEMVKK